MQSSLQFLHNSANARIASQPGAIGCRAGSAATDWRGSEGDQSDFAGFHLLWIGFASRAERFDRGPGEVPGSRREATNGRDDALHAFARVECFARAFLDPAAL